MRKTQRYLWWLACTIGQFEQEGSQSHQAGSVLMKDAAWHLAIYWATIHCLASICIQCGFAGGALLLFGISWVARLESQCASSTKNLITERQAEKMANAVDLDVQRQIRYSIFSTYQLSLSWLNVLLDSRSINPRSPTHDRQIETSNILYYILRSRYGLHSVRVFIKALEQILVTIVYVKSLTWWPIIGAALALRACSAAVYRALERILDYSVMDHFSSLKDKQVAALQIIYEILSCSANRIKCAHHQYIPKMFDTGQAIGLRISNICRHACVADPYDFINSSAWGGSQQARDLNSYIASIRLERNRIDHQMNNHRHGELAPNKILGLPEYRWGFIRIIDCLHTCVDSIVSLITSRFLTTSKFVHDVIGASTIFSNRHDRYRDSLTTRIMSLSKHCSTHDVLSLKNTHTTNT